METLEMDFYLIQIKGGHSYKSGHSSGQVSIQIIYYFCAMECRQDCGACCIAISISSPIPGMPDGKPAGVRCIHLMNDYKCALFNDPSRPKVCGDYKAEPDFCGSDREEAIRIINSLL